MGVDDYCTMGITSKLYIADSDSLANFVKILFIPFTKIYTDSYFSFL